MTYFKKTILPIFLIGVWINISMTIAWLLILESYWVDKYQSLNLIFPSGLTINIMWMIWGFMFAIIIFILSKKYSLLQTTLLSWFVTFVVPWNMIWTMGVLPTGMLLFNIPNTLFMTFIGAVISKKLNN